MVGIVGGMNVVERGEEDVAKGLELMGREVVGWEVEIGVNEEMGREAVDENELVEVRAVVGKSWAEVSTDVRGIIVDTAARLEERGKVGAGLEDGVAMMEGWGVAMVVGGRPIDEEESVDTGTQEEL